MTIEVDITHRFAGFEVNAAFATPPGLTVLFGRSGSGKTSVINAVAGLLRPDSGVIRVDGVPMVDTTKRLHVPPHRRRMGYVFQDARLFPHLSVEGNLRYAERFGPAATPAKHSDIIEMLSLGDLLQRKPVDLSGGEKQRVAIGRALLSNPRALLADEPLSSLDAAHKDEILPYFETLRDEVSIPILYVTHSAAELARLATSVVVLNKGKVMRHGTPNEVLGDPDLIPTSVRDIGTVLNATVTRHHEDGLTELNADGVTILLPRTPHDIGSRLRVRILAQDVMLATTPPRGISALNVIDGTISALRPGDGPGVMATVDTRAGPLLARITKRSAARLNLSVGMTCSAIVKTVAIARGDVGEGR